MCFYIERLGKEYSIISIMKVTALLKKWCMDCLCYTTKVRDEEIRIELDDIPMVYEFPDVSPEELQGLPPQREIDFESD